MWPDPHPSVWQGNSIPTVTHAGTDADTGTAATAVLAVFLDMAIFTFSAAETATTGGGISPALECTPGSPDPAGSSSPGPTSLVVGSPGEKRISDLNLPVWKQVRGTKPEPCGNIHLAAPSVAEIPPGEVD